MKRFVLVTILLLTEVLAPAAPASATAFPRIVEDAAAGLRIVEGPRIHLPPVHVEPIVPPSVAGAIDAAAPYGATDATEVRSLDALRARVQEQVRDIVDEISENVDVEELSIDCAKEAFQSAGKAAENLSPDTPVRQVFEGAFGGCVSGALQNQGVPSAAAGPAGSELAEYLADAVSGPVAEAATEASGAIVWANWLTATGGDLTPAADPVPEPDDPPASPTGTGTGSAPDEDKTPWGAIAAVALGLLAVGGGAWYAARS